MSLCRLAIRVATVAALRGATWAGDAVKDSAIPPFDELQEGEARPFISVYTDDGSFTPTGRDLFSSKGDFSLVIEVGVSAKMTFQLENGELQDAPGKPPTDAQMELTLDLIERQIRLTLHDATNPWAEMWRRLISDVSTVHTRRGSDAEKGVRFAGRQIELSITPYAEPPRTARAGGLWGDFIALLERDDDPGLNALAGIVRAAIEPDEDMPPYQQMLETLNLSRGEGDAMLVTNPEGVTDQSIVTTTASPAVPT